MKILFDIFLVLHIISGVLGLISGTLNVIRKKGDRIHKLIGRAFLYGMVTSGLSALVLSTIHTNYFLFTIGIFSIYMVGTGNRYLRLKSLNEFPGVTAVDWILTGGMAVASLLFIYLGIRTLIGNNLFGIVYIVFSVIGIGFAKADFDNFYSRSRSKNFWLLAHLQRMTGGYIASLTAFLVVNSNYVGLPPLLLWLAPTAIFTPLIFVWSGKYGTDKRILNQSNAGKS